MNAAGLLGAIKLGLWIAVVICTAAVGCFAFMVLVMKLHELADWIREVRVKRRLQRQVEHDWTPAPPIK